MKRLVDGAPPALKEGLRAAQDALGSASDVERLREKLGALPPRSAQAVQSAEGARALPSGVKALVVIGGAALVIAGMRMWRPQPAREPLRAAVAHEAPASVRSAEPARVQPPEPQPVAPTAMQVVGPPPKARVNAHRATRATENAPKESTAGELALLEAAHDAIERSPRRALVLLEQHGRVYPNGNFVQERESLAIEALRALGESTAARTRARAFIARFPSASNAKHLRGWLDAENDRIDHKAGAEPLPTH